MAGRAIVSPLLVRGVGNKRYVIELNSSFVSSIRELVQHSVHSVAIE